jgi:hypothetical protein
MIDTRRWNREVRRTLTASHCCLLPSYPKWRHVHRNPHSLNAESFTDFRGTAHMSLSTLMQFDACIGLRIFLPLLLWLFFVSFGMMLRFVVLRFIWPDVTFLLFFVSFRLRVNYMLSVVGHLFLSIPAVWPVQLCVQVTNTSKSIDLTFLTHFIVSDSV